MTRQALEEAYIKGFQDGRESADKVQEDDAADHCILSFDGWHRSKVMNQPTPMQDEDPELWGDK